MLGLVKHESKDPEVLMVTGWQQQEGPESHSLAPRSFPPSSAPRPPPPKFRWTNYDAIYSLHIVNMLCHSPIMNWFFRQLGCFSENSSSGFLT